MLSRIVTFRWSVGLRHKRAVYRGVRLGDAHLLWFLCEFVLSVVYNPLKINTRFILSLFWLKK